MRNARILQLYLLRLFAPALVSALGLFALSLELVDLFANLWRFLAIGARAVDVLRVMLLYLPSALSSALPIALLFAASFSLGSLYADNELTVVFGSGVSLTRLCVPLFAIAVALSGLSFFFDDAIVLPTLREKNKLARELLRQSASQSNADVAVISRDSAVVYRAEYYEDAGQSLSGVTVIERDERGEPKARTEAATARWDGARWVFGRVRRFERRPDGSWTELSFGSWVGEGLDESPDAFKSQNRDLREMSVSELAVYGEFLERAGLPFEGALAERHKRFSFALTPVVVILLAGATGGRFRKNVLLASLLASLLAATAYYVSQMIAMLLAKTGIVDPVAGAWFPLAAFLAAGASLFRKART